MVFTILAILSSHFSGIKYIYIVVKPSHHPSLLVLQNHEILTPQTSLPPCPACHHSTFCLSESDCSGDFVSVESYNI